MLAIPFDRTAARQRTFRGSALTDLDDPDLASMRRRIEQRFRGLVVSTAASGAYFAGAIIELDIVASFRGSCFLYRRWLIELVFDNGESLIEQMQDPPRAYPLYVDDS